MEHCWNRNDRGKQQYSLLAQKHILLSLRPPKIPHKLAREIVPSFAKNGIVEAWGKILSVNTEGHRGRVRSIKSGQANSKYKTCSLNSLITTVPQVSPTSTSNRVDLQCEVAACLVGFPQVTAPAVGTTWHTRSCKRENSDAPIAFKIYNSMQHPDGFVSSEKTFTHFVVQDCRTL